MKIAIFADNFYPELSGLSDSIIVLAKHLAILGHQVSFFVPRYQQRDFTRANLKASEIDLGPNISIKRLPSFSYPAPTDQGRLVLPLGFSLWSLSKFKPDVIHTQSFFGVGLEALLAAKLFKIPLVGTNHTPITEFTSYTPFRSRLFDKLSLKYVAWYYNQCAYVTAPDQEVIVEMKANGFHGVARSLANPVELDQFQPVSLSVKKKLKAKFGLSSPTVLYTGRLAPEKHVDVLIRAIALVKQELPEVKLAISGHGLLAASLRQLVEKNGLQSNVRFFGTVDQKTHRQFYQAADIFAIASTAETQSLSLMKAMTSGLPVIGVRARALPEYINQQNGFLVGVGDVRAMAKKILLLMKNRKLAHQLGEQGMKDVQKFSANKIVQQWEEIYSRIAKHK